MSRDRRLIVGRFCRQGIFQFGDVYFVDVFEGEVICALAMCVDRKISRSDNLITGESRIAANHSSLWILRYIP